jgi:hypothetical protein
MTGCTNPAAKNFNPSATEDDGSCVYLEKVGDVCYYFEDVPAEQIEDKSFTLSYSLDTNNWVFFHSYVPDFYFSTRQKLHTIKGRSIFQHNSGAPGKYYSQEAQPFFIDVVFNFGDDAILNSLSWVTEVINRSTQINEEFSTITHISIWNQWQHTGRIAISSIFNTLEVSNARKTKSQWSFNEFRDIVRDSGTAFIGDIFSKFAVDSAKLDQNLPWYEKKLLQDDHFIIRLEFDNSENKDVILHDIKPDVTRSVR